jgi:serine/threonine-protein phosphatase PP1-1
MAVSNMGGAAPTNCGGPDQWLEMAKHCKYLSEVDMKRLCELVKECLMEGSYSIPYLV